MSSSNSPSASKQATPESESKEPTTAEWKAFSDHLKRLIMDEESIKRIEDVVEEDKRRAAQGRTDWVELDPDTELTGPGMPSKETYRKLRELREKAWDKGMGMGKEKAKDGADDRSAQGGGFMGPFSSGATHDDASITSIPTASAKPHEQAPSDAKDPEVSDNSGISST